MTWTTSAWPVRPEHTNKDVADKIKYNIIGEKDYELRSKFNYSSKDSYLYDYMKDEWRFPAGEHCFKLKVHDPKEVVPVGVIEGVDK